MATDLVSKTFKLMIPKRLEGRLQQATEELKAELESEDRSYPTAVVRRAVEKAFSDLGNTDLLCLIGRANAILADACGSLHNGFSEESDQSVGSSANLPDSGHGSRKPSKTGDAPEENGHVETNGHLHVSPISIQTSTPKAIINGTTPTRSPCKAGNTSLKNHMSPYRNNMVPYKMNISRVNKTADQSSIQRVINESNIGNRSIAVADRSRTLVSHFVLSSASKLKQIVAYIMWRTGVPMIYEDDVFEAAVLCRCPDFLTWRDAAYEAWTHVLPISIRFAPVLNNLYVGSLDSARYNDFQLLKENSITHLVVYTEMPIDDEELAVDPVEEFRKATKGGIQVHVVPQKEYDVFYFSYELLEFIHEGRCDDRSVVILCDSDGMAAAGSILAVYLMVNNDREWDTAMLAVKGAHEDFAPVNTIEKISKRAHSGVPFPDDVDKWRQKMIPSNGDVIDVFQADELMFQGCLRDYHRWISKIQKRAAADDASVKDQKMLEDWMSVRQFFYDESIERACDRRKSGSFCGFESPVVNECGRLSRANSVCGSPRALFGGNY